MSVERLTHKGAELVITSRLKKDGDMLWFGVVMTRDGSTTMLLKGHRAFPTRELLLSAYTPALYYLGDLHNLC